MLIGRGIGLACIGLRWTTAPRDDEAGVRCPHPAPGGQMTTPKSTATTTSRGDSDAWSNDAPGIVGAIALLSGVVVYGLLATAYDKFYAELGLTRADVGMQYGKTLGGAAALTILVFVMMGTCTWAFRAQPRLPRIPVGLRRVTNRCAGDRGGTGSGPARGQCCHRRSAGWVGPGGVVGRALCRATQTIWVTARAPDPRSGWSGRGGRHMAGVVGGDERVRQLPSRPDQGRWLGRATRERGSGLLLGPGDADQAPGFDRQCG